MTKRKRETMSEQPVVQICYGPRDELTTWAWEESDDSEDEKTDRLPEPLASGWPDGGSLCPEVRRHRMFLPQTFEDGLEIMDKVFHRPDELQQDSPELEDLRRYADNLDEHVNLIVNKDAGRLTLRLTARHGFFVEGLSRWITRVRMTARILTNASPRDEQHASVQKLWAYTREGVLWAFVMAAALHSLGLWEDDIELEDIMNKLIGCSYYSRTRYRNIMARRNAERGLSS